MVRPAIRPHETGFTRSVDRRVLRTATAAALFSGRQSMVVGLSGGQDSTALALILQRLRLKLELDLTLAHFDHQLRGRRDAAGDLGFVDALAASLDTRIEHGTAPVKAIARERKLSLEDAARRERYGFLKEIARKRKAGSVAVGHTRADRAETVLLHLMRGAGIEGLTALPPLAPWPFGRGPDLVRPLLGLSREDTLRYCRESGVEPREDPTNALPVATRNRVRLELMPLLRTFNPRIDEALVRLAGSLAGDRSALDIVADAEWARLSHKRGRTVRFELEALRQLPAALATRLVRRASAELGADAPSARQLDAVIATLSSPAASTSLPGDLLATAGKRWLEIRPRGPGK